MAEIYAETFDILPSVISIGVIHLLGRWNWMWKVLLLYYFVPKFSCYSVCHGIALA